MEIRTGRVSSVDKTRHTAQVTFDDAASIDAGGYVSYDLQVLVTRPGDYSLPDVNAMVVCLLLPGSSGAGFVLGALYNETDAAPAGDATIRSVKSDDLRLGDISATKFAAFAKQTDDNLDALKQAINGLTYDVLLDASVPIAGTAGPYPIALSAGKLKPANPPVGNLPSVACGKVKVI